MLEHIIAWSLRNRLIVVALSLAVAGLGLHALSELDIDAFPDTTPVQVQVNTVAAALGPEEIERQVTIPVESAIAGLSGLAEVRSISKFGLSQVTATFEDSVDLYRARQQIGERLASVELPPGVGRPEMGPVATGLGEVFHFLVVGRSESPATLTELTTVAQWVIRPQLLSVPGVAEVNIWGGRHKRFEVVVDPQRLVKFDLTIDDLAEALRRNNVIVGGGQVWRAGEAAVVRGVAQAGSVEEIGRIVVRSVGGSPVYVHDLAEVREGHEIRRGGVTAGGQGEVVLGLAFMLMGENSHAVTRRLAAKLEEIRSSLPPNVDVLVVYQRTELVDHVLATVRRNLLEGALLVIAVLFALLGNLRAGLIVALAIPLAMLFSFSAMLRFGIAASLLSLGAIDFGLVVDSSVILVENVCRRLALERQAGGTRPLVEIVRDAAVEVRRPTMFGELIIMVVYLPILLLEGVEGRLFRPMALTVVFALGSSMVFSLTLIPVLCSFFLSHQAGHRENPLVRWLQALYRPVIRFSLRWRWSTVLIGAAAVGGAAVLAGRLGAAFLPRLYEEAIVVNTVRLAGVSLDESLRYGSRIEKLLLARFPDEIRQVWSRTGTARIATDPMGLEVTDVFVTLQPRANWKRTHTQAQLAAQIAEQLEGMPGMRSILTQPIEMRINEMAAGIRSDVGVKIFGDDLERLRDLAARVQTVLAGLPGSADVTAEQITGQPVLEVAADREALGRYGVSAAHVLETVEAIGGIVVGQVREGERRFDLAIVLPDALREDAAALGELLVASPGGQQVPLSMLASIRELEGPSTIQREWHKRRIVVQCNVRGRDLAGFVEQARRAIAEQVELPAGYFIRFGGQFEHLIRASQRLMIIVPIVLLSVFLLLYLSVGSLRDALLVLTGVPLAASGGVAALWLRGIEFTISAAVGFVAVCGVSVLAGLVLVTTIRRKLSEGLSVDEAIEQTRLLRLRPILMTALVAALGFVPMALNTGVGAEVQRPLATVVIGGIVADNVLTLLVLPPLYSLFGSRTVRETRS